MRLEQALAGAIASIRESTAPAPTSVAGIVDLFGGGKQGNSALAVELSGTTDKSSKAYKAALRNVERYNAPAGRQQRTPNAATQERLAKAAERKINADALAKIKAKGITVHLAGRVIVSPSGTRPDERERDISGVYIAPEDVAPMVDELAGRHMNAAADEFNAAFFDAYGMGFAIISNVDTLDIGLGDGDGDL